MGCAIIRDNIGIRYDKITDKFNGQMFKMACDVAGYTLEDLSKAISIRYDHLVEIQEGLCQPTEYELSKIIEYLEVFTRRGYFMETYIKEKPTETFICGSGIQPCENCGEPSDFLCDYPVGEGKTCDLPLCRKCRTHVGKYDFCPIHTEKNKVIKMIES
jgi:hypothetical protein